MRGKKKKALPKFIPAQEKKPGHTLGQKRGNVPDQEREKYIEEAGGKQIRRGHNLVKPSKESR